MRVRPDDVPEVAAELDRAARRLRANVRAGRSTRCRSRGPPIGEMLKLMLLGALNWSQTWYRPGRDSPRIVARRFVRLFRETATLG